MVRAHAINKESDRTAHQTLPYSVEASEPRESVLQKGEC